jgi:hypothetical protein
MHRSARPGRRHFIRSVAVAAVGAAGLPLEAFGEATVGSGRSPEWDLSFLDTLHGTHRQVFDCGEAAEFPLHVVGNWLRAHREVFGLEPSQLTTIVGIAYSGFPINASDALWAKYPLGRLWRIDDPRTHELAKRNIFFDVTEADERAVPALKVEDSVSALVRGGTIFWQCYNGLQSAARAVAGDVKGDVAKVQRDLQAGLLPHVKLVPAHTMLLGLAQERGCAYEAL